MLHLLTAGTDAGNPWLSWSVIATTVTVATLGLVRLLRPRRRTSRGQGRRPAPHADVAGPRHVDSRA